MARVDDEVLELLEKLSSAVAPGPWRASIEGRDHSSGSDVILTNLSDPYPGVDIHVTTDDGKADADLLDFIALARTHLPAIIGEVRRYRS